MLPSAAAAVFRSGKTVKTVIRAPAAVIEPVADGSELLAPDLSLFFGGFGGIFNLQGGRADSHLDARTVRFHENNPVFPVALALLAPLFLPRGLVVMVVIVVVMV